MDEKPEYSLETPEWERKTSRWRRKIFAAGSHNTEAISFFHPGFVTAHLVF
jgi:hypothetical protein